MPTPAESLMDAIGHAAGIVEKGDPVTAAELREYRAANVLGPVGGRSAAFQSAMRLALRTAVARAPRPQDKLAFNRMAGSLFPGPN